MIILSGNVNLLDEYEPDIFIVTNIKGYNFDVPYTFFFDGTKVLVYQYSSVKFTVEKKIDIKIGKQIFRILLGNEIGIAENYVKLPPDLFICFEKTNYPSKFFYRKAQMWIGAQISSSKVLGHIIYNGTTNRMLFVSEGKENSRILFEGTMYIILDDEFLSTSYENKKGENKGENNDRQ